MFKVYWTVPETNEAISVDCNSLTVALARCEDLRKRGRTFVTMVSENPNHVGKIGVAGVSDGVMPDGEKYEWTKNDRVGAAFKNKLPSVSTDNVTVELDDTH